MVISGDAKFRTCVGGDVQDSNRYARWFGEW